MKKLILIMAVILLMVPIFASNGDTLNIGGVVPLILDLTVAPAANFDNLNLVTAGADVAVSPVIASLTISTNNSAGWSLYIYSSNFDTTGTCSLRNDDNDPVTYTLEYAGTGSTGNLAVASSNGTLYGEASADVDETADLSITYDQSATYPAGYYSDQLTIVLRAK